MILKKPREEEPDRVIPERKIINMKEYYEIEFWSAKFGISPEQLKRAVQQTGSIIPADIEAYLKKP